MALAARIFILWLAGCAAAFAQPAPDFQLLEDAQVVLRPAGSVPSARRLTLTHRWDSEFPGRAGEAEYRLQLPPRVGTATMALLFSRIGNQATAEVNGVRVMTLGVLGDPSSDATKSPHLALLPPTLLQEDGGNELLVRITAQPLRWGGLSDVRYGAEPALHREYNLQRLWRNTASIIFCVALALMGLMALGLWARLRDSLFACFAAAAFLGIFRNLDRVWSDLPVPWPLWGVINSTAYAWHLMLICVFSLLALGRPRPRLMRLLWAYFAIAPVLVVASFALGKPVLWTAALVLLAPLGMMTWAAVVDHAARGPERGAVAWLLAGAGGLAVLAGLHDLGFIRLGLGGETRFSATPHIMFLFVAIMAGIIVDRYARNAAGMKALNQTLESRVLAKEEELRATFAQLQERQAAQATMDERQRIMRDLHDGVGAQLVGLLNMIKQPGALPEVLEGQVKAALDEMRLAVDSMQIGDGDLTTALATLRYRVQPRLAAARLEMHWEVDDLPPLAGMTPHAVLQVQRIVLEALTNVLKHAQADTVWLRCALVAQGTQLLLEVGDNGCGLPVTDGPVRGQGLANMRSRAHTLGAALEIGARPGGGTLVRMAWPLAPTVQAGDEP